MLGICYLEFWQQPCEEALFPFTDENTRAQRSEGLIQALTDINGRARIDGGSSELSQILLAQIRLLSQLVAAPVAAAAHSR